MATKAMCSSYNICHAGRSRKFRITLLGPRFDDGPNK
jgi:hypothetical protein